MSSKPTPKVLDRVYRAAGVLLKRDGRISYPAMFVEIGILTKKDLEAWRRGQVPFLERVIKSNLTKLARMQKALRRYARERGLVRHIGKRPKCRYSKTRQPFVEEEYRAVYKLKKKPAAVKAED